MSYQIMPLTSETFVQMGLEAGAGLPSLDELRTYERMCTTETVLHRLAAVTPQRRMVGFGLTVTGPWDPILKAGHFEVRVHVEPGWRGRGVGGTVYRNLEEFAQVHGAVALEGCVGDEEPEDRAWAERRGFAVVQHVYPSELDLSAFAPGAFSGVCDRARGAGIAFASLAQCPATDEWFGRFLDFYWELCEEVPGMSGRTRPDIAQMKELLMGGPHWEPAGAILAVHGGQWVAMSWVLRQNQHGYYNQMTGVRREYRRMGLGLAVKLQAIEYARSQGARTMQTHNDSTNEAMLAVNRELGFRPRPGIFWLKRFLG